MSRLMVATDAESRQVHSLSWPRSFFLIAAVFLLTIGAGLRIFHLGNRSLWYDEAVTANASRGTLSHMIEKTRRFSAPVIHPYILYLAERAGQGPVAVRAPSVVASFLSIVMMLVMVRVKVSRNAAIFAAAVLALSASQIRYAQEVREYSLAVLWASVLIFALLKWENANSRRAHPVFLYVTLFIAPLIQYGLVLFSVAILSTIVFRLLLTRSTVFSPSRLAIASAFLAAGGVLSLLLTLRYQFQAGGTQWYLVQQYFDPKTVSFLAFLKKNSHELLVFIIPGHLADLCMIVAAIVFCIRQILVRKVDTITILFFTSLSLVICCSVARLYPFGGIRQCLFLAPVFALFLGTSFAEILLRIKTSMQPVAVVILLALITFSLLRGTLSERPYGEIEDTQSILKELAKSSASSDQVWVNHDAVAAFEFYMHDKDPRFVYGSYHSNLNDYMPELRGSIAQQTNRLWIVFSHLTQASDRAERQLILDSLSSEWNVRPVLTPTNTALYVAYRKIPDG
jgi:uncharacterized membrane protein